MGSPSILSALHLHILVLNISHIWSIPIFLRTVWSKVESTGQCLAGRPLQRILGLPFYFFCLRFWLVLLNTQMYVHRLWNTLCVSVCMHAWVCGVCVCVWDCASEGKGYSHNRVERHWNLTQPLSAGRCGWRSFRVQAPTPWRPFPNNRNLDKPLNLSEYQFPKPNMFSLPHILVVHYFKE